MDTVIFTVISKPRAVAAVSYYSSFNRALPLGDTDFSRVDFAGFVHERDFAMIDIAGMCVIAIETPRFPIRSRAMAITAAVVTVVAVAEAVN